MSIVPLTYAEAKGWLTYPEWLRLDGRRRNRSVRPQTEAMDFGEFIQRLTASGLKASVQKTLLFMLDWCDAYGWCCISKVRIAAATGVSTRTVERHWKAAREAGFLRSFDYPAELRRTSDHWLLWPDIGVMTGDAGLDYWARLPESHWKGYEERAGYSTGEPPF